MTSFSQSPERSTGWSAEALALAAQAKVLSGNKLEQLVVRLQRHSGRPREACWRFVIQHGLKGKVDHRRWTDEEVDLVREEIVKRSVDEVARKLGRTPKSVRSMLQRNRLGVREIRCDLFSLESLAKALHIRREEIRFWIQQGWLQAAASTNGRKRSYTITPESLAHAYKHHLPDLLKRGIPNQSLFEAYVQYVHSPKHTVGEQLLDVRRDKRERAAHAAINGNGIGQQNAQENDDDDENDEEYRISLGGDTGYRDERTNSSE
jgi:DNA-binding transcriptional MerR regulator